MKSNLYYFLGLIFSLFIVSQNGVAQTMTLSSPSSSGTAQDNLAVVFSISGETGTISNVRVVFTYLSGYYTANVGKKDSVTMFSISATQSFSFNPSKITSSALFRANTGNLVDGVYSVLLIIPEE
jgi:hypothetical protein